MRTLGSVDAVVASIREEANAEIERIVALGETPPSAATAGEGAGAPQRIAAERKRNDERLAQMEWEEKRRLIEEREAWIARVIARANEILAQADEATIERLVREAKRSIGSSDVDVEIVPTGGCIVRCGALVVDNTFEERARRLEPLWRKALAAMYRV